MQGLVGGLLVAVLMSATAPAFAQSVATAKFYASIITFGPDGRDYMKGRKVPAIGMHPTSAEIAKQNACVQYKTNDDSCTRPGNFTTCGNGGYFAVTEHIVQNGKAPMGNPAYENVVGISCGKKTVALAEEAALASCEAARTKFGLPSVPPGTDPMTGFYNCKTLFSGRNDGTYSGEVKDFGAWDRNHAPNEFLSLRPFCWGIEGKNIYGPQADLCTK